MKPWGLPAYRAYPIAPVDAGPIPQDNHVPAKVPQQVSEERAHLVVRDVLPMTLEVKAEEATSGTDRDTRDDRDPISPVAMSDSRSDSTRRPGLAQRRDQEEARFVDEDEVGTQPCCVFFTWGHRRRFHCSILSSSRSIARRSGFW